MDELEEDIRATAQSIEADADRLAAIEDEKKALGSGDPRLLELSREAEAISRRLVPKTIAERALVIEGQS
ncbi:MAG: hypothetical protein QOE66_3342 [Chloroflexota bacterium]|jgi:hypothetical protein|nr:hypothetical protein [Chloroflexota bacterium]